MELVFYTNPQSRGRIVRWMLEEVNATYTTQILDFGAMNTTEFLTINPMGKVPALRHGDIVITETAAICAYLADAFPQAGLAPASDDPARGAYYRWFFYAAGPLEAAMHNNNLGFVVPPEKQGAMGYRNYAAALDVLEQALSRTPYITGDRFTAADLFLGAQLGFGLAFGWVEKRPAFETYVQRATARPAYARATALDDAAVKSR